MYNDAFARAVLAVRERDRDAALFLKRLDGYDPARFRRWVNRSPITYVRGIAASVRRRCRRLMLSGRLPGADAESGSSEFRVAGHEACCEHRRVFSSVGPSC